MEMLPPRGSRQMTTFKKEPMAKPYKAAATSQKANGRLPIRSGPFRFRRRPKAIG